MAIEAFSIGKEILLPLLFMGCLFLLVYNLDRYLKERYGMEDPVEEILMRLAVSMGCSVYFIFCLSGKEWNLPEERILYDFKEYLLFHRIPYYVRHFARRNLNRLLKTGGKIHNFFTFPL